MKAWWRGLEPRERRTLLIGGIALGAILYYFLLWLPPRQAVTSLRESVAEQRETLAWMRHAAAEAKALQGSAPERDNAGGSDDQALYAVADRTARESGLEDAIDRVEPAGEGRVRVDLEAAGFDPMVRWLARLRRDRGVAIDTVSIRAADRPGRVDVQLVLSGGGA